uniref:Uncharacterized protein n=1 Tax=Ixodes ricinus TaxID=34613 RepID=A0A6B0UNN2_IXORI
MLNRMRSAFSLSPRLSMMASSSLLALFLSSSTRSMRFFPKGLISLSTRAMMMSIPLLSCMAMQFWFSWQGPWQYSVRVSNVWFTRSTLCSFMYSPSRPKPPVVLPQRQSRNSSVSDTKL